MKLEELMKTDGFKSLRLAEQIYLIVHKTPIDDGGQIFQVGSLKSAEIAQEIINLLKERGTIYQEGETEEITFGEPTWFITIEDAKM